MIIAYYDESGDDGFPAYSSKLFVLTSLYFHHANWKEYYNGIYEFRRFLKGDFQFPLKMEMHARSFLLNKMPYKTLNFSDEKRLEIFGLYCSFISSLGSQGMHVINTVINKPAIKTSTYNVLDRALTYSIQRIENDLNKWDPASRFMIITDPGRLGKMRHIARKIQKVNYIPSKFGPSSYRKEISRLIEDPLPKESDQSYFIQIADLVSYIVNLYMSLHLGLGSLPARMPAQVDLAKITAWMNTLKSSFNLAASSSNPYGIVCYPK